MNTPTQSQKDRRTESKKSTYKHIVSFQKEKNKGKIVKKATKKKHSIKKRPKLKMTLSFFSEYKTRQECRI